MGKSGWVYHRA